MPPGAYSREQFCDGITDENGLLYLSEPAPFGYVERADNVLFVTGQGDTLASIAATRFASFPRPAGLWWAVADFQPQPIFDPTVPLVPGTVLVLPSERLLVEEMFSQGRRDQQDS
jgi:hypothetical protein